ARHPAGPGHHRHRAPGGPPAPGARGARREDPAALTRPLVLATANRGKAREMRALLVGLPCRILDLADVPSAVRLPPEGVASYEANARGKARAVTGQTGSLALADDSGLEVDALGGQPGPLSARYGGEGLSDEARYRALLAELRGVPPGRRGARFRTVIAIVA